MAAILGTDIVAGYNPQWYCNGSFLAGWLGCPNGVLTSQQQMDQMRGNFGGASDPSLVDQAVSNFGTYLDQSGYEKAIATAQCQDSLLGCSPFGNIPWSTIGLVTVGAVVLYTMVAMPDYSSARRYGR
jgi:hypothetical protein